MRTSELSQAANNVAIDEENVMDRRYELQKK
jgi:hypothetical protein